MLAVKSSSDTPFALSTETPSRRPASSNVTPVPCSNLSAVHSPPLHTRASSLRPPPPTPPFVSKNPTPPRNAPVRHPGPEQLPPVQTDSPRRTLPTTSIIAAAAAGCLNPHSADATAT